MWADWLETIGETPESTDLQYSSWYFADNEKDADELVELAELEAVLARIEAVG